MADPAWGVSDITIKVTTNSKVQTRVSVLGYFRARRLGAETHLRGAHCLELHVLTLDHKAEVLRYLYEPTAVSNRATINPVNNYSTDPWKLESPGYRHDPATRMGHLTKLTG